MFIKYKISNLHLGAHKADFKNQVQEVDDLKIFDILNRLQYFGEFNAEQQNSILIEVQSIFNSKSTDFFGDQKKIQIISDFISIFINQSQCVCSISLFLQFLTEWTFLHDVEDDPFANEEATLSFLLFHSIQNTFFDDDIQTLSLASLLNIINDSKIMRIGLICSCLNDETQLSQFVDMVLTSQNQLIPKIIFRIFNIILKLEEIDQINFNIVIENLIYPSISNLFFNFPYECIEFVSSYLMRIENGKKCFLSNVITKIPYKKVYQSVHEFSEEKNGEFLSFLRCLIDNNDWENEFHVYIDFDSIITIIKNQGNSVDLQKRFCELLISYFRHPSLYDIKYNYTPLFDLLYSMTNGDFKILEYVLSVYYTIFISNRDLTFFNPLLTIPQNVDDLMNFFIDFFENDSDDLSEKAFQIILSIMQLLSNFDYLIENGAEKIKVFIQSILISDRFNSNEKIYIIQEKFNALFPGELEIDQ